MFCIIIFSPPVSRAFLFKWFVGSQFLSIAEHLHHLVSAYLLEGRFDPTLVCAMLLPHFICAKLRSQFSPLVLA
jgi:hypothetical protein